MAFKNLYFGLVSLLAGLLASVYFASEKLDQESFGSPDFDRQVAVSVPNGGLKKEGLAFKYSPSIRRHLTLPTLLSGAVVVAVALGIVAGRKESKKEPNQSLQPTGANARG
jgi:hypothetical protein